MKLIVKEPFEVVQHYETAAWYTKKLILPGEYEVKMEGFGCYGHPVHSCRFEAEIVKDHTPSLWCGMPISGEDRGDKPGTKTTHLIRFGDYESKFPEIKAPFSGVKHVEFIE